MIDRNTLLAPPFAADPPVKLNISAKTLGLVMAILSGISAFFGVVGLLGILGLSTVALAFGGILLLAVIGFAISVAGAILSAWGGYQMFKERREGKALAIYGLVLVSSATSCPLWADPAIWWAGSSARSSASSSTTSW